ncbi:nucleotidyltransferase domain-containing protein [Spongisporangium articulatum]|uniref:Nucleotidyltransferase domain-containing protein n=1 Tax=Spongisporangium articulatum TaxID=3362603 RepID=A0ABW8AJR6_9ACTN
MTDQESAAEALLRARLLGGLTQTELAGRAGLTQSVVSAYESARRQPSVPVLRALVDAAGFDLVFELRPYPVELARLNGPVGRRVRRNREALKAAAAEVGVTNLRVFGSVARGEDRPDSDVDLLVDLPVDQPGGFSLIKLIQLGDALKGIVEADVDVVPESGLKPYVRERVVHELVAL